MTKSSNLNSLALAVYACMFVLVSLFIYTANDETQPLVGILRPGYLIPCMIYSSVVVLISFAIFRTIGSVVQKRSIALGIALFGGIPAAIYILFHFTNWFFK